MFTSTVIFDKPIPCQTQGARLQVKHCNSSTEPDEVSQPDINWFLLQLVFTGEHGRQRVILALADTREEIMRRAEAVLAACTNLPYMILDT